MKKAKFIQDAKLAPSRFYRNPADIIRDRRLNNEDRLEILEAWERETIQTLLDDAEIPGHERLEQLRRLRRELEQSRDGQTANRQ